MASPSLPPLAVIAGPTASGKSAFALRMAETRRGVIINADASQCYCDLSVLSARPSPAETARAPHRLYGFLDAEAPLGAAGWADLARREIGRAHEQGLLPILVGGTGLYLRTLLHGIAPVPDIDPDVRAAVRALDTGALAEALAREDPGMAARLHPNDTQRMARALEVIRSTGASLGDHQAQLSGGLLGAVALEPAVVEIDRDELGRRCDARFDAMLAEGGLDEAARLLALGLDPALPVMKAIGVPPLIAHLKGDCTLGEAVLRAKLDTRRYAKRQRTWFRNQTPDWPRLRP
ncbi:tRNA (adenosine(37)-N6)-dimethylallyltransferase MiaA [Sphingosinicella microcystinivorans]|uniref:tRNA (adenosine(37)-N6)-dimethylallyltransferase MiaA n=1 Tax=Sphingosinicella microcystinivorans TaxID=335406 RepID=UPI0022F3E387|nr:tRNA (adenosine(37)-N6)-dimethylallyltransferase MiaA [Sphingosinicella microcystinivorans]WBX83651.1 tRNA (adenosine(37)-N6)-dimethylallyltransferase MiaA [Sphingosinicella microcystinivorans]